MDGRPRLPAPRADGRDRLLGPDVPRPRLSARGRRRVTRASFGTAELPRRIERVDQDEPVVGIDGDQPTSSSTPRGGTSSDAGPAPLRSDDISRAPAGRRAARARRAAARIRRAEAFSTCTPRTTPSMLGLDLVHELHGLEDAERLARRDDVADLDERRRARLRRAIEGADHRRLDAHERAAGCGAPAEDRARAPRAALRRRRRRRRGGRASSGPRFASRPPRSSPRRCPTPGRSARSPGRARRGSRRPPPGRRRAGRARGSPRSSRSASSPNKPSRSSSSSLAAMPSARSRTSSSGGVTSSSLSGSAVSWTTRSSAGSIGRGRRAEGTRDEAAYLVDDDEVAARREDVDDRLRGEYLADRRCERRPARLGADPVELREHLVEPVAGAFRLERVVDPRDDARGQVVARGEHGDARHERSHELVADVLVDEVGRLPERVDVDAGVEPDPAERLGERLARDPVQGQRKRIDRAGDELRARARRRERGGERAAAGSLGVDPDGQPARLGERIARAPPRCAAAASRSDRGGGRAPRRARAASARARSASRSRRCGRGCRRGRPRSPAPRRRSPPRPRAGSRRR